LQPAEIFPLLTVCDSVPALIAEKAVSHQDSAPRAQAGDFVAGHFSGANIFDNGRMMIGYCLIGRPEGEE